MKDSKKASDKELEADIYKVERRLLERMRNSGVASVAIVSVPFQGGESALILSGSGSWAVKSMMGSYNIANPLLDKLLEKFALITSSEFQDKFGNNNQNDYECERQRLRDLEKLLRLKRRELMVAFLGKMVSALLPLAPPPS